MGEEVIVEREKKVISFLKEKKDYLIYIFVAVFIYIGCYIRTLNLGLLKDVTTGGYIPSDLDAMVFLRYATDIVQNGGLAAIDYMRNFPIGFPLNIEGPLLSYFIAYLYKFIHFFNPAITLAYIDVIYPVVCFAIGAIFFYLLVKKLFDYKVALVALSFFSMIPAYIQRTTAGISDKEALGLMLMFMVLYFYVVSFKEKDVQKSIFFGVLSGISAGLMGAAWGGVNFIFLIIGVFELIRLFLSKFSEKSFYVYCAWFLAFIIIAATTWGTRFSISSFMLGFTSGILVLVLFIGIIDFILFKKDLLKIKEKITQRMPKGIFNFILAFIIVIAGITLFVDHTFVYTKSVDLVNDMIYPLKDRWALTVAESHEPYITDWFGQMGGHVNLLFLLGVNTGVFYIWLFLAATIFLFYEAIKGIKKHTAYITLFFAAFLISFVFSRYSANSVLNGTTPLAKFMYVGSLAIFIIATGAFYLFNYYKNKEVFESIHKIKKEYIFLMVLVLIMIMGGRRAARLILMLAPITAIVVSFMGWKLADYFKDIKDKTTKFISIGALIVIGLIIAMSFFNTASAQAQSMGPIYNQQWQVAGKWINENTPENSVFAHWWDYGYLVQTGGNRATITDGGNAVGYWNYLMGRHVLTGKSDEEALDFLYSHDANYVLFVADEIGKYPAFSSIGSDANYDRYSWITTFVLDTQNTQETRNQTIYLYRGSFVLDEDFIYQGKIYPKGAAGIGGIFVPISNVDMQDGNQTKVVSTMDQPNAALIYNGQQLNIPLKCVFTDGKKMEFPGDGIDGCLRIIPSIESNQMNPMGGALFLSKKVKDTRFAEWYLFGESSKNFELVYNDEDKMPLALYNGMLIGPLKIWKVNYPSGMEKKEIYLQTSFPDISVTKI